MPIAVIINLSADRGVAFQTNKIVCTILAAASGENICQANAGDGAIGLRSGKVPYIFEAAVHSLALCQVAAAALDILRIVSII